MLTERTLSEHASGTVAFTKENVGKALQTLSTATANDYAEFLGRATGDLSIFWASGRIVGMVEEGVSAVGKPLTFLRDAKKAQRAATTVTAEGRANAATYVHKPLEAWAFDKRIKDQLLDPRLGNLAGKLDNKMLYKLAHNPNATFYLDANSGILHKGHINIIQKIDGLKDGMVLRITVVRDEMKIISVGIVKESSYLKYTTPGGRYIKISPKHIGPSNKM